MTAEAGYLVAYGMLEAKNNADRHNHDSQSDGHSNRCYLDGGPTDILVFLLTILS
jgi:hypothetical protein